MVSIDKSCKIVFMSLSQSEKISARLYCNFLLEKGLSPTWKIGDDPPDIVFEYNGIIQAVEVTELHKYFSDGDGVVSEKTEARSDVRPSAGRE